MKKLIVAIAIILVLCAGFVYAWDGPLPPDGAPVNTSWDGPLPPGSAPITVGWDGPLPPDGAPII
jgi:hypothetical protein